MVNLYPQITYSTLMSHGGHLVLRGFPFDITIGHVTEGESLFQHED